MRNFAMNSRLALSGVRAYVASCAILLRVVARVRAYVAKPSQLRCRAGQCLRANVRSFTRRGVCQTRHCDF